MLPSEFFAKNKQNLKIDDFEVIKKLGEGNFTEVFKVTHSAFANMFFALKICKLSKV